MRVLWVDTTKFVGILLVVFGHAWRGLNEAGLAIPLDLFLIVDSAIYAFHMPLFFFLSGLFFLDMIRSTRLDNVLRNRFKRLIWPLCLWTWIFFGLKLIAGGAQNTGVSVDQFPIIPIPPLYHFWFLWALFLCHVSVALIDQTVLRSRRWSVPRWAFGVGAILWAGMVLVFPVWPAWLAGAMVHVPFFLAGIAAGGLIAMRPPIRVAVACSVAAAILIAVATIHPPSVLHTLGIVLLLCTAFSGFDRNSPEAGKAVRTMRKLGAVSMAIYLMHTIFSAGMREALIVLNVTNVPVHLALATFVGMVFPYHVYQSARRHKLAGYLGL